ncbi:MAG: hypothetical protein ACR2LX_17425 [Jatrophihabitans sp.]
MNLRERTPADTQALSALLRRVHDTDGYPTVWPGDVGSWLAGDDAYGAWVADLKGSASVT